VPAIAAVFVAAVFAEVRSAVLIALLTIVLAARLPSGAADSLAKAESLTNISVDLAQTTAFAVAVVIEVIRVGRESMTTEEIAKMAEGGAVGTVDGIAVGAAVGLADGAAVGDAVGIAEGAAVGDAVGIAEGAAVGDAVGIAEGTAVGDAVGIAEGTAVGDAVGIAEGTAVGDAVGMAECADVGDAVGMAEGAAVGDAVGMADGTAYDIVGKAALIDCCPPICTRTFRFSPVPAGRAGTTQRINTSARCTKQCNALNHHGSNAPDSAPSIIAPSVTASKKL
jgi:UDP-3-O-[3-hydroxymyristoyl] glucosamine N-acyltransferase